MNRRDDALTRAQRTRTGRVWAALVPALLFLLLLIIFIAENGQRVEVKFFGATGHISLALALLISAVAGAILVLLIGSVRIAQLRLAAWRHRRGVDGSAAPAAAHETQAVETESDAHGTRP
ncbi:MAG TPA: LapA family protein [Mycobacteriales bacterium]|nr:LapA family protein [Mycobacteriales bacterium]